MNEQVGRESLQHELASFVLRMRKDGGYATVGTSVLELKSILLKHVRPELRQQEKGGNRNG
jgi:hypothetical protein